MVDHWKKDMRAWAVQAAEAFAARSGVMGVLIGGSLGRGQEWRHSDLELGLLVDAQSSDLLPLNVFQGRGVEVLQLVRADLETQLIQAENGEIGPVVRWPIQFYDCRVIKDPTGLLGRMKDVFDMRLFEPDVMDLKVTLAQQKVKVTLNQARSLLSEKRPRLALATARVAMNEAIMGLHWARGVLPRSQNRTGSRLRQLCRAHDLMPFYDIYCEVFGLKNKDRAIRVYWPKAKEAALEVIRQWGGEPARDFFNLAVDSEFKWRQNASILTVYRLYLPVLNAPEGSISMLLDDPAWAAQNLPLLNFLGLTRIDADTAARLIERIDEARKIIEKNRLVVI